MTRVLTVEKNNAETADEREVEIGEPISWQHHRKK